MNGSSRLSTTWKVPAEYAGSTAAPARINENAEKSLGDTVNRAVSHIRQRRSVMQRTVVVIAFALGIGLSAPAAAQEWMEFNHIEAKTDSVL